ncbi:hypothetical protein JW899_02270 [Candidatus Uhrbacteria bacterium]|nr:hypothetical protein [Candidatus Uhrbacteria bacterium]
MINKWKIAAVFGVFFFCGSVGAAGTETVVFPPEPPFSVRKVTAEDVRTAKTADRPILESMFGSQADNVSRFNRIDSDSVRVGTELRVPGIPPGRTYSPMPTVIGWKAKKAVIIDLGRQFLGVYEKGRIVASFPVSCRCCSGNGKLLSVKGKQMVSFRGRQGGEFRVFVVSLSGGHRIRYGQLPGYGSGTDISLKIGDAHSFFRWIGTGVVPVRIVCP